MTAATALQYAILFLTVHDVVSCQKGENVEAVWTDGSWRAATILEVRDLSNGMCGSYRIAWHHTRICEDTSTEYWGDDLKANTFCVVSRNSIRMCEKELCRWSGTAATNSNSYSNYESTGTGLQNEEESNRHVGPIVALVVLSLFACCICLRRAVKECYETHEVDVEKAIDAATPSARWALTPKSMNSSPMAKWIDKTRRAAGPSNKNINMVMTPGLAGTVSPSIENGRKQKFDEQKHTQPGPKGMIQTHGTALRQAARVHGGSLVPLPQNTFVPPPQNICPPPQLPTLLQHRQGGPIKSPPRKKAPLQGVPPQEPRSESIVWEHNSLACNMAYSQSRKGQTKYGTRNQALGRP